MPETTAFDSRQGFRSTLIGVAANGALVIIKLLAGVLGNSYALIADALESALDVFSSLLVYGGLRVAARPPDEDHPYGHGRAESLAALFIGVVMMGAAVILAIQSVREILTPHHTPAPFTLIVLVAVVVTKEVLFRFVHTVGQSTGSTAVQAEAWHHRSDAITSLAAFIGISLALMMGPGYENADDWAALLACSIIAFNGYRILRPAVAELMDATTNIEIEEKVRSLALTVPGVSGLDKCRVRKYGLSYVVDLHVVVRGEMSVREGHDIAHRVKDVLRQSNLQIADVLVHIEPTAS
ncbi:MAG TPA: cation diffusion facilitator family transporter [Planctomycetota bacterium]|nr:cation diffusion facilitator family transporter [Planctomycetota bacterium]